jgi:hypothetical protein
MENPMTEPDDVELELPDVGTVDDDDPVEIDEEDLGDDEYLEAAENHVAEDHPDVDDDDEVEVVYEEGEG